MYNSHKNVLKDLFQAIENGRLGQVRNILNNNINLINAQNNASNSCLMIAIEKKQEKIAKFLLQQPNIEINLTNQYNESPLIVSIMDNNINIGTEILKRTDVDLHIQSYLYGTALTAAIFFDSKLTDTLLAKEENFQDKNHPGALLTAVRQNNPVVIEELIKAGADINAFGMDGYQKPPLWIWDEVVSYPFQYYGPPVFDLPIVIAMQDERSEALKTLINWGANMDIKGASNLSAKDLLNDKSISQEVRNLVKDKINSISKSGDKSGNKSSFFDKDSHSISAPAVKKEKISTASSKEGKIKDNECAKIKLEGGL